MSRNASDADVESAFGRMTLDELSRMQDVLFEQLRSGLPSTEQIATALERHDADVAAWFRVRDSRGEAVKVVMLLGALAVAIAWLTHRHMAAPSPRIQEAIARVREDHVYMLPIPRSDPCFCGSGSLFRACHGRPPIAAPAV
ncbi:SEC-C domain-containing protein [Mycolicibacterium hodleri]|uniref:SEC-C domain-containing protein n=1 Tax=Mycolicibacterium hodleri TaxID=49897 RepID=UPI0013762DC5|nr:SEC-C domain-containing protein [Mycolicibacterium hodleri]